MGIWEYIDWNVCIQFCESKYQMCEGGGGAIDVCGGRGGGLMSVEGEVWMGIGGANGGWGVKQIGWVWRGVGIGGTEKGGANGGGEGKVEQLEDVE